MILPPPTVCLLLLFLCSLALPIVASMPLSLLSVSLLLLFSFLPSLFFSPNPTLPLPSSISVSSSPFSSLLSPFPLLHYPSLLLLFLLMPLSSSSLSLSLLSLPPTVRHYDGSTLGQREARENDGCLEERPSPRGTKIQLLLWRCENVNFSSHLISY